MGQEVLVSRFGQGTSHAETNGRWVSTREGLSMAMGKERNDYPTGGDADMGSSISLAGAGEIRPRMVGGFLV